jgi:membrane fusion protein (multidrug efflux system)
MEAGRLVLPKGGNFEVALRLADGSLYPKTGRINFADVRVSPTTGTRESRAEVPNPNGLHPGEFVRVILKGATRPNATTVPQRAVLEGPQGKFVYVVDEKSTAQARPVQLGEWVGDSWIVTDGLKPGEKVIVDGLMRIGPGAPVRIADPNQPAQPPQQSSKPPAKK